MLPSSAFPFFLAMMKALSEKIGRECMHRDRTRKNNPHRGDAETPAFLLNSLTILPFRAMNGTARPVYRPFWMPGQ
jgi:hypothetical protein